MDGMYMFDIDRHGDKASLYADMAAALAALTADEPDAIANMANAAALIWEYLPDLNWAGFYRAIGQELVLGPFQGKTACIRIPFGKGVCGTAADTRTAQCVSDVHEFPGHIACDAYSASELVVPIVHEGRLIGVLDLDSPIKGRFDEQDVVGCAELMAVLGPRIAG
jgi:GAF domain-containing protein